MSENVAPSVAPERLTLTVPQAAELLGISPGKAWGEVRSGRLRSFKIGKRRLIPREEPAAYVQRLANPQ